MKGEEERSGAAFVDAHCHIDLFPDPAAVVSEAETGAIHTIAVTNAPSVFFHTRDLARGTRFVHAAVGLHPELVPARRHELDRMWSMLEETRLVGEVGLDSVTGDPSERRAQREVFSRIVERCAACRDKVLSVHSRRAAGDVLDIVGENFPGTVILHWFSGTVRELERAVRCGCRFSVGPAMVKSKHGIELLKAMPAERVLTETDGPFVKAGTRHARPIDVVSVVNEIAKLWQTTEEEARKRIFRTFTEILEVR